MDSSAKRARTDEGGDEPARTLTLDAVLEERVQQLVRAALAHSQSSLTAAADPSLQKQLDDCKARISLQNEEIKQLKCQLDKTERLVQSLQREVGCKRSQVCQGPEENPEPGKELQGKLTLKVGTKKFTTFAETLRAFPESFFGLMVSGRVPQKCESDGSIFIDRSSKTFSHVLEFLRCGGKGFTTKNLPSRQGEREELLREADFYNLPQLVRLLRDVYVVASHGVTIENNGAVLQGKKLSAATLDVPDPHNFEVTFSLKNGKAYSRAKPLLVGVAPIDAKLDAEWEVRVFAGSEHRVPPVVDSGLFIKFREDSVLLLNPSQDPSLPPPSRGWGTGSKLQSVKVCFERTEAMCKIAFRVEYLAKKCGSWTAMETNARSTVLDADITADSSLPLHAEYRPILFFDHQCFVKIEKP